MHKTFKEDLIGIGLIVYAFVRPWFKGQSAWDGVVESSWVLAFMLAYHWLRAVWVVWKELSISSVIEVTSGLYRADETLDRHPVVNAPPRFLQAKLALFSTLFLLLLIGALWGEHAFREAQEMRKAAKERDADVNVPIDVFLAWDSDRHKCRTFIDTWQLRTFSHDYFLYVVCLYEDPSVDKYYDTRIEVSSPFTISGAKQEIDIVYSSAMKDQTGVSTGTQTLHMVFLLPKSADISRIKRVHDVKDNHGKLLIYGRANGQSAHVP